MKQIFVLLGGVGALCLFAAVSVAESASVLTMLLLIGLGLLCIAASVFCTQLYRAVKRYQRKQRYLREQERIVFRTRLDYHPITF